MAIPKHVFREYDIRGLTSTELTPDFAAALGRGFAAYLQEKCPGAQSIALGRDGRIYGGTYPGGKLAAHAFRLSHQLAAFEGLFYQRQKFFKVERLFDEIKGACFGRFDSRLY